MTVSDGAGSWRACRLRLGRGGAAGLVTEGPIEPEARPEPVLTLAVALPKGDRGDWAVQKLTELGIDRIIVVGSARSALRWVAEALGPDPAAHRRASAAMERLGRIARQAAMQARLTRLPELVGPVPVAEVLGRPEPAGSVPVGADRPGPALVPPGSLAVAEPGSERPLGLEHPAVLIGPEGGWSEGEIPADLPRVGLGPSILRTETAAVAAATVLSLRRAGVA